MTSKYRKPYVRREPKRHGSMKGVYPFCGCTCCGVTGKALRKELRAKKKADHKAAIKEGLQDYNK